MTKTSFSRPIDYDHLHDLRRYEISFILRFLPVGKNNLSILNFGAGDGYQSKLLEDLGFAVTSIDLPCSRHAKFNHSHVIEYDGLNIPFGDQTFDIIFSSNVLEHISPATYRQIFSELSRVSKTDSLHLHILPTPRWRLYSSVTYYSSLIRSVFSFICFHAFAKLINIRNNNSDCSTVNVESLTQIKTQSSRPRKIFAFFARLRLLLPPSHGYQYSSFREILEYSSFSWMKVFNSNNMRILNKTDVDIVYTGYSLFGKLLPISLRRKLSIPFGASTRIFVLRRWI